MTRIGLSTSSIFPLKLEDGFRLAKDGGYDGLELMITGANDSRDILKIRSLEDKYEMPVISVHAPVLILTHFVWGTDPEVKLIKTAEFAKLLGSETVVVHPPFSWQGRYAADFLTLVESIEETTGVKIAVENMFNWKVRKFEAIAYKPSWEEIVDEAENVTLDFSHAALSGIDSLATAKYLGERLSHIHLCDGFGVVNGKSKIWDEHLAPGEGNQPVAETLQFLADSGWNGNIVTEVNTRKYKTYDEKLEVLANAASYARKFFEKPAS